MKLVMTLLCKDEEDVVEANLVYHLERGVDHVIATDNGSRDGTLEILERHEREGHLHLIREYEQTYDQANWVTRMARLAATEFGADWVINNDADEFWWPSEGSLKDVLGEVPDSYGIVSAPRSNFIPRPASEGFFADRMTVREVHSRRPRGEGYLLPKVCHRGHPEVFNPRGNHWARAAGLRQVRGWHPITILHFPIRSYPQWERKLRHQDAGLRSGLRAQDDPWFALLQEGKLLDAYSAMALDDEEVDIGVENGSLVIDRRLRTFFSRTPALTKEVARFQPWGGDDVDEAVLVALERQARIIGSITEHEEEVVRARVALERRINQLERKVVRLRRRGARDSRAARRAKEEAVGAQRRERRTLLAARRAKEKAVRAKRRQRQAVQRAVRIERSRWWRLGRALTALPRLVRANSSREALRRARRRKLLLGSRQDTG